jgi:spermidine/putrescine transport system ATP-binding protein
LDKARKPAAFSTKGLSKTTIEYLELRKWYQYNIPINKKFDKEVNHYNEVDHEISYWQNYPMIQKQKFENKNTNRLLTNDEIKAAAKSIIEKVGLVGNENKYPSELSGGMQQRVALARALVIKPSILLLDEPLSALDAKVRKQMQYELKRLHREFKLTFILVTHDQEEALSLSDKVVVMSKGKIQQVGSP